MKNKLKLSLLVILLSLVSVQALQITDELAVEGQFLSLLTHTKSKNSNQSGFDFAANLTYIYTVSAQLEAVMQWQSGPGKGVLGLVGPQNQLTDLSLTYRPNEASQYTFGSFDTPFGLETARLSNNAGTSGQVFIVNGLLYEALAGKMGTLNTLGIKTEHDLDYLKVVAMLSNGTGENAVNQDGKFASLLQVSSQAICEGLETGLSLWHSDDASDLDPSDSKQLDVAAYLLDLNYRYDQHLITTHYGQLTLEKLSNTKSLKNKIDVASIAYQYQVQDWKLGLKVSSWRPKIDAKQASIDTLPKPGFASGDAKEKRQRFQLAASYAISEALHVMAEFGQDQYEQSENVNYALVGLNLAF
eukprot:COSAG01_NODE_547_length_15635_cov_102.896498_13_plen_358_part_00